MLTTTLKTPIGLALVALLLAYAALHGAWTVFHWGGPEVVARIAGSPLVLPGLVATALAFWRAQNESQPSARHGWRLLAVALTLYRVGLVMWAYYTVSVASIPFPSAADPLFLAFPWIFFASLLALTREQLSQLERRRVLLNTAVMLGAVGLVEWVLLLRNTVAVDADTPFASVVALLYPLGDLIMVGGLLFTVLLALGRVRQLYLLPMIGGSALFVVGNLVYAVQIAAGSYRAASPLDITWTLSLVLFSVAALVPNRTVAAGQSRQDTPSGLTPVPNVLTGGLLLT